MCKLILATSLIVGYAYGVELWSAWYGGNQFEQYALRNRMVGPYAPCYWTMIACNVVIPQLLWFRRVRTTPWMMFLLSLLVNVGMWFERFVIVITSQHRDYLPSSWKMFYPTWADYLQLLGGFGLFLTLFLIFVRFLPMIAVSEVKACLPEADPHRYEDPGEVATGAVVVDPSFVGGGDSPLHGLLARFEGPGRMLAAVQRLREAGYRRLDTFSPFPVHGMESALGLRRSWVSAFTLAGGLVGLTFGQWVQWYQSAVAYPLITDGKPYNSAEAFVPISYETMILYASFASVIGMLLLNGLPRLYHPVFRGRTFDRASTDGFFVAVEAHDPLFDPRETAALLASLGGTDVELLEA
jgi:hypothetical protein